MLFKKLLQSDGKEVSRTEKTLALGINSGICYYLTQNEHRKRVRVIRVPA